MAVQFRVKVEKDEKAVTGAEEEGSKKDTVCEKGEDRDTKSKEEQASPAGEGDGGIDGGDKDEGAPEPTENYKQDNQMDVEETPVKTDVPENKAEQQEKLQIEEKNVNGDEQTEQCRSETSESRDEQTEQCRSETSESRQTEAEEEEKTEVVQRRYPTEVVQRRYPTRNRGGEEKAASQSVKASGSKSEDKKHGNSDTARDESSEGNNTRAASVKSDSGSDKENMNSETAVDLSNAGTPDVIMLSDEEETEEQRKQSKEKKAKMKKLVRRLQTQLRNEEAKLVLLKKLRQSQLTQVQEHAPVANNSNNQLTKQAIPRQQGGPPPLVRGNQQSRGSNLHMQQQQNRTPSQGQMRNMQGPPPLVGPSRMGANTPNGHSGQNLRNSTPHISQHGSSSLRPVQQQQTVQHQQAATPPQPPVDTQTPAQRQAAAKLALRKQLEKTLLQIPPPKPPAPEMNFIPSLACPDFVLLLGLEEVVNHIIDLQLIARGQKSPDEKFICNPFTCVQCGTDYTPVWKREKPGSKNVICEHCVTWNQKRALKQEHTNRLKSAFVKALQQEQEIERMQAQTPSNPSTPTPSVTPPTSASSSAPSQVLAAAAAASNVAAAAAMSMSSASFRPSAEHVRHHHSFLQAHQAQLRAGQSMPGLQGFGARSSFPYSLPYVKQADLQRQYLLDMIPRAAGMPWKP